MQRFTYAHKASALRSHVTMLIAVLMGDVVVILVAALLVPGWWKAAAAGGGAVLVAAAVWNLTGALRTSHGLDQRVLALRFGRFALDVPRDAIRRVGPYRDGLPRGLDLPTRPVSYRPEADTLYLLADRRGLVVVELSLPVEARTRRLGAMPFTRLVMSVDEPDRFVAAFGSCAEVVPEPALTRGPVAVLPKGEAALHLDGLRKQFGDFAAVDGVSLAVAPGEVLAFLGSNGAGKTTTVKMMTGLLRPTAGTVRLCGQDFWSGGPEVRQLIGYVPDVPMLYEGLTAREFLWLVGGLYGLDRPSARARGEELLALMGLQRWSDQQIRRFSLGMKRKMAIAAALVHRPRVLVLDEVTNGLDPRAAREVKDLIAGAAREGTAVFLTTHLLDVVEELAHRIAIIDRGRLRAVGTLAELRTRAGRPGAGLEELFLTLTAPEAEVRA